ncbi:Protein of unknown function [Cotesia congregata]|uniref:Uncharacterized protein n=1 Tax=Cotesia congregata TaxID=51543 RepID=A0A8J2HDR4_COTCN|nr:Protein of unknown function [Cotesia congregata]
MANNVSERSKSNAWICSYTGENYLAELQICYDTHLRVMDCPNVYWSDERLETDIRYLEKLPKM